MTKSRGIGRGGWNPGTGRRVADTVEEYNFLRQYHYTDHQIAEKLGIQYESLRQAIRRHLKRESENSQ